MMGEEFYNKMTRIKKIERMCENFSRLPSLSVSRKLKTETTSTEELPPVQNRELNKVIELLKNSLKNSPPKAMKFAILRKKRVLTETSSKLGPGAYSMSVSDNAGFAFSSLPRMLEKIEHSLKCKV